MNGSHFREKQSVGISMPSRTAASRIVVPAGTSISRLSTTMCGMRHYQTR